MNIVHLILGSNKGEKFQLIISSSLKIENLIGKIILKSDIYKSKPWGNRNQPDFLNQVICVETNLSPQNLLKQILKIEEDLGRTRTTRKWVERTIDIDILFFNNEIICEENLKIPHPLINQRKFVLLPLSSIAGNYIHPEFNLTINELLIKCNDNLPVELL